VNKALPPEAYGAALAALPGMGPGRLRDLLTRWAPSAAWASAGDRRVDVGEGWQAYGQGAVDVHVLGHAGYPEVLAADHQPPAVVFSRGDLAVLDGPRVAIVGSRRCTRYGRDVAFDLGRDLAEAGVRVVSGLALGIDGAAHLGALAAGGGAAPPVAVVGSGLDVVYPAAHARLWAQVAEAGVLLSEAPLTARPEPWRFPARNRILAALADVVVVVESRAPGGSFHTVKAADERGIGVMAVPGPVRSPASAYTNELLVSGAAPARDVVDVLVALHLIGRAPAHRRRTSQTLLPDDPDQTALLDAMGWQPASLEQLVARTGLSPGQASVALARAEVGGWVVGGAGWWEQVRKEAPAK
jgi:DNA processing protein